MFVDEVDLVELVKLVERPFAEAEGHPDIAGTYVGLSPRWACESLSGIPDPGLSDDGKAPLLVCSSCRESGCWPLLAHVRFIEDEVVWSDFEQPHRRDAWSYDALGKLVFDRVLYEVELEKLAS